MNIKAPVITIDGPSGSGKGTIAGILAKRLGWCLLDSGALYRLLAFAAHNHGVDLTNEELLTKLAAHLDVQFIAATEGQLQRIILEGDEVSDVIRTESIGAGASRGCAARRARGAAAAPARIPGGAGPGGRWPRHGHGGVSRGAAEDFPDRQRRGAGTPPLLAVEGQSRWC